MSAGWGEGGGGGEGHLEMVRESSWDARLDRGAPSGSDAHLSPNFSALLSPSPTQNAMFFWLFCFFPLILPGWQVSSFSHQHAKAWHTWTINAIPMRRCLNSTLPCLRPSKLKLPLTDTISYAFNPSEELYRPKSNIASRLAVTVDSY